MSDLLNQYRQDFVQMADTILKTPGAPKKVFAHALNVRFINPLRQQNVDEGIICELRDEAFRIFDSRRVVNRNRSARQREQAVLKYQVKNGKDVRYEAPNEVPRVNGVRR